MAAYSSKTEHHDGGASRVCPLFAELRPNLETLFRESASEGAVYVVTKHRLGGINLRQELGRIIRRAWLSAWPKLFHNLRATRKRTDAGVRLGDRLQFPSGCGQALRDVGRSECRLPPRCRFRFAVNSRH